jgi:hypothetical protein
VSSQEHPVGEILPLDAPHSSGQSYWSRQRAVQIAWITFALVLLVVFVANIPTIIQDAETICVLPDVGSCPIDQFTPAYAQIFTQVHVPLGVAEGLLATLCVVLSIVYWLLGLLIFWRKSDEPIGVVVSLALIMFGAAGILGYNLPEQSPALFQFLTEVITYGLMWPVIMVLFFTVGHWSYSCHSLW